jgi:hypothetical protein
MITLPELNNKYTGLFEFEEINAGQRIQIKILSAYLIDATSGDPIYVTYEIERDHRSVPMDDFSRWLELADKNEKPFQRISYCGGLGIYQVVHNGEFFAYDDLPEETQDKIRSALELCDDKIISAIPELEEILLQEGQRTFTYKGRRQKVHPQLPNQDI